MMKRILPPLLLLLSAASACLFAADTLQVWDYHSLDYVKLIASPGCEAAIRPAALKTPEGGKTLQLQLRKLNRESNLNHTVQLQYLSHLPLEKGVRYELSFLCRAAAAGSFKVAAAMGEPPWNEIFSRTVQATGEWQEVSLSFTPEKTFTGTLHLPRLMCGNYGSETTLYFGPVTLKKVPDEVPFALNPNWELAFADGKTRSVELKDDTLDLRALAGKESGKRAEATLTNRFHSAAAGVMKTGFAADWWFAATLNGVPVYDTLKTGNRSQDFLPDDHIVDLPVKAGENLLEVKVLAGSNGWRFSCGKPTFRPRGTVIAENEEWRPFVMPRSVKSGSVLDFSALGLHDAPAGKHGRVIINGDGKFAFADAPEKPVRFFGTNLYFDVNFPDREQADRLADYLVACGYNAVRFHHFDYLLTFSDDPGRTRLNPAQLDRLDYLQAALKKRGIYQTLDLNTLRARAMGKDGFDILFRPEERERFFRFAAALLRHVNPYTGSAWKDEPALAMVSALNEDTPFFYMGTGGKTPPQVLAAFEDDLAKKGVVPASETERKILLEKFIVQVQRETYPPIRERLVEIGLKAPQTDQNVWSSVGMALIRRKLDYVDNHFYYDHPVSTGGKLPVSIANRSALSEFVGGRSAFYLPGPFAARIIGKPYIITEFNFCGPNQYRAEGGALVGAYAALQDWDGLFRYGFAGSLKLFEEDFVAGASFDSVDDPMKLYADRLLALLFLRRDVSPSEKSIPIAVPENYPDSRGKWRMGGLGYGGNYPAPLANLGFVARIGSTVKPDSEIAPGEFRADSDDFPQRFEIGGGVLDLSRRRARSTTGELELDSVNSLFKISTPRTAALVFVREGDFTAGPLRAVNRNGFASLSFSSLDGKPLAESGRILGLHLTNALNTGMRFSDRSMSVLEDYGTLPRLIRRGSAEVTLKLAPGAKPAVFAVGPDGSRLGELPVEFSEDGTLRFSADTFRFPVPCIAYEITR